MKKSSVKPSNAPLWKETYDLANYMYSQLEELIANFPDEKWTTVSKLRNSTSDSMFYVAQATGSSMSDATIFDWNSARKNLFTVRSMYIFAGKQKFLKLDPDIVVRIDKLMSEIDTKLVLAQKEIDKKIALDLEPWLEKYRIWQKISE